MSKKRKVIVTVAPTGNIPTKEINPYTPISPEEIVEDILKCREAGAAVAHIHARDRNGEPTNDRKIYQEILSGVKAKSDVITMISTGARGGKGKQRGNCIELKPEMASLSTGSSNFKTTVNANSPDLIKYLARRMKKFGVIPELEAFDVAMIDNARFFCQKGTLQPPLHFNLVMNVPGSIKGTPKNLLHMVELLPANTNFTVTGIGNAHVEMITLGIILGGNIRVGLEDVIMYDQDTLASNVALVERAVRIIKYLGHEVASPAEAREILDL